MTDPMTDLNELRAELEEFSPPEKKEGLSPREERIIAGFEGIQRFFDQHEHAPQHGEDKDIFERLYAVRLDHLRVLEECRTLLADHDHDGLLTNRIFVGKTGWVRIQALISETLFCRDMNRKATRNQRLLFGCPAPSSCHAMQDLLYYHPAYPIANRD